DTLDALASADPPCCQYAPRVARELHSFPTRRSSDLNGIETCREQDEIGGWAPTEVGAMKAAAVRTAREAEVRAKFFRLLEADREGPEFEGLFREVDEALDELSSAAQAAGANGVAPSEEGGR